MNGNINRIRIPKSWILLAVFIVSVIGAGAWVFTTPPNGITDTSGSRFGNTSNTENNYIADNFSAMNYFGVVVGTYLDGYSCGSDYCIYRPWYDTPKYYAKNGTTGRIDFLGTNGATVINSAIASLVNGGDVKLDVGTFAANIIINNDYITLEGSGYGTRVQANSGDIINITSDFVTVKNLFISGNAYQGVNGISTYGAARLQLQTIWIEQVADTGILFQGASASASSHAAQLSNIRLLNIGGNGIWLKSFAYDTEMSNVWIGSPAILNNNANFVGIRDEGGATMMSNIHVWNSSSDGISIKSNAVKVSNSYIESNLFSGIHVYQGFIHNQINNVYFWDNGQRSGTSWTADIWLVNTSDNVITGNIFVADKTNKVNAHIDMNGTTFNTTVSGNSFDGKAKSGNVIGNYTNFSQFNVGMSSPYIAGAGVTITNNYDGTFTITSP